MARISKPGPLAWHGLRCWPGCGIVDATDLVLDEEVVTKIAEETTAEEPRLERQREALEHCMKKVPGAQRDLLMQAYQPESRIQEVAQSSGRSVTGFYQWLHRMRRMLLECIRRAMSEEVAS
jgi:RNA polymerase sigma-70 factor (ECF subfamily)